MWNTHYDITFSAAILEEKKRQSEDLKKQRDSCIARAEKMKREMKDLKKTKDDLIVAHGRRSPSPKTIGFIKQNEKLQVRIFAYLCYRELFSTCLFAHCDWIV